MRSDALPWLESISRETSARVQKTGQFMLSYEEYAPYFGRRHGHFEEHRHRHSGHDTGLPDRRAIVL